MFDVPVGRVYLFQKELALFCGNVVVWCWERTGVVGFGNCTGWVFYLLDCTFGLFLDKKQAFGV